ncbi:hypothetical protein [Pseudomonas rubra]|uniref:Lipoprotein n=1 Tax=Pseudomonas rubra TaxID=2942627 RepID=A0ABT5PG34_9PSED|nr:hypothetical protein [Pseudomonas rubra]MDD1017274.1 hypothetical protein [Pseudomonas rubra]MDD1041781.1 hypothetical protein [Pseudomonas rubra]MDD1158059.1 hypothetical protein [Pseudomonas rubra]
MKQWKLALLAMVSVSVSVAGCWQGDYAFEGKYFATEGEDCTTPSSATDREQYFLEITKQVHNGTALYSAKFPIAARAGAPIVAAQSVPATDDDELTFNFTKPEVSGAFSGSPAVDIVITVIPNESKAGHLWLKKAELTSVRNGKVSEADLLMNLRRATTIGKTGACLKKGSDIHRL